MKKFLPLILLALLIIPASLVWAQNSDEREVVVTGTGLNEEDAKKQAYRNAIQSVIGSLVVAETLVENDQLVRDKILSHSDGYITKVAQVGKPETLTSGLVSVTMRVTVKSKQLREKLSAENITLAALDGESLFTRKVTEKESKKDAAAIVKDALKDLPAAVVKAEASVEKATIEAEGGVNQVTLPVEVFVDEEAYGKFIRGFMGALEGLGYKRKTGNTSIRDLDSYDPKKHCLQLDIGELIRTVYDPKFSRGGGDYRHAKETFIFIGEVANRANNSIRMSLFTVPSEVGLVFNARPTTLTVNVDILDGTGASITRGEFTLATPDSFYHVENVVVPGLNILRRHNKNRNWSYQICSAMIMPAVQMVDQGDSLTLPIKPRLTQAVSFQLTDAELRQAKSVKCTVGNVE